MEGQSALAPYRALDLTNERGFLCGKILGDLGADVIKIELPGGDPSRNIGPFYHNLPDPEKSLYWYAFNTSKRGITLDIGSLEGRETFRKLLSTAHFVIESFPLGHMEALGLGYNELSRLNPGLIMTSITPFGQTGPYRDFKVSDLVAMALGGRMQVTGDPDRPPLRITVPQAYFHAGLHAAVGSLIALHHRQRTGQGQWVDVSMHETLVRTITDELPMWENSRIPTFRCGVGQLMGQFLFRIIRPCKDGHVTFRLIGGVGAPILRPLVEWMAEEGKAGFLKEVDLNAINFITMPEAEFYAMDEAFNQFFAHYTKAELYEQAVKRGFPLCPGNSAKDILEYEQLKARDFWVQVPHPELGQTITYPGAPYKFGHPLWRISRRAPLIGEHNDQVMAELAAEIASKTQVLSPEGKPDKPGPQKALEGVRVIDFTWVIAGPLITKYLADFGAQVVKIESRSRPDLIRNTQPFKDGIMGLNRAAPFTQYNTSKLSLGVDMTNPRGLEVVKRLIAKADVVTNNYAPGTMSRLGLGYDDLCKIKPDIILLSASAQGQTGPHATFSGYGWNLNGLGGFTHIAGWPDRQCVSPHTAYTDVIAPWYGVVAILAALEYRRRTGHGQHIDLSQFEAGLSFLSSALLDYVVNGRLQGREGNLSPYAVPHNAYPCRGEEQWCTIAVFTQEEWIAFCQAIGSPSWTQDGRFATFEGRKRNEAELDALIAHWTLNHSAVEAMSRMQEAGVAAGKVQSARDLLETDPQLRHRQYFQLATHPEIGPCLHQGWAVKLSRTPAQLRPAPCLGEHTEFVCREILDMSDEEFVQLLAEGVLQ